MLQRTLGRLGGPDSSPPFLPLAFRLFASFGLLILHLALPEEGRAAGPGEGIYLASLGLLFAEAAWECGRGLRQHEALFPTPALVWIRWNLALDLLLVALVLAFQGVMQERLSTLYIFPVLASAFYLGTVEIVWVGVLSSSSHILLVSAFASGLLPPFGLSGEGAAPEGARLAFLLGIASLQIFATTLVVVLIRRNLERLRTDLSASEATVDELAALHRRVVDSMSSGLITLDPAGRITSANPAAEAILGRAVSLGAPLQSFLPGGDPLPAQHGWEHRFERVVVLEGRGQRILGGHLTSLRGADGRESGQLLLFQDLTELKALEERTRISERLAAIGQLTAGLAHELRNPLASISGCVQLLRQREGPPDVQERVLGILERETHRVGAIVSDFLDFARPEAPPGVRLSLAKVLEEARASWEMDPRAEGLSLVIHPPPKAFLWADPLGLHRVLMNLLSNARKAVQGRKEPQVSLTASLREGALRITVADNGCGMTREQLDRLFVPFAGSFEEGSGLGMSLVYKFTEAMGWRIAVDSRPEKGTRVQIIMPGAISEETLADPRDSQ
ncbi:nitrogen regulation protein NR(II) [Geothrix sp. 21YS21S-4]|uniref:two-component system sensor histidine kinase NtrB n=1 Tax=Geothrix sp. 21YS21S-4 TaxID=3068889 RepID=UPI0027B8DF82|nr:ATP-binding protein [Geothrix sp. 21YS21S-4]